jgi:hypothetical protein
MTKEEWLKYFDENLSKFVWFIEKLPVHHSHLINARANENLPFMLSLMNDIWFLLPDNQFNIRENPQGWQEFLTLLENPFQ